MSVNPPPFVFHQGVHRFFTRALIQESADLEKLELTSYFRTPHENAAVGGDPWSQHLVGWAIDVVGDDAGEFAKRVRRAGLIAVQESDHLHIQVFPAGALRRLFLGY